MFKPFKHALSTVKEHYFSTLYKFTLSRKGIIKLR